MLGQKAEQTCCRLASGEDGCQHPGLHDGLSPLPLAMLLAYLLLLRTPFPENSFHSMVGNESKSINSSEQGKSRALNHSHQEVPGKAGSSQKAGLGGVTR